MKKIFFYLFLSLTCLGCTKKSTQNIPKQDLEQLNAFFELLIKDYDFAYTLFGQKPCSIAVYQTQYSFRNSSLESIIFEDGWSQWCRYHHLFPSQNFVLKKLTNQGEFDLKELFIINKKSTLKILKEHLFLFQRALYCDYQAEDFLKKMIEDDEFLKKMINNAELLGILLGYGKVNATNFARRFELCLYLNALSTPPLTINWNELNPISLQFVKAYSGITDFSNISSKFSDSKSAIDELNTLTTALEVFELPNSDFLLEKFQSPIFMVINENSETQLLYQEYAKTRSAIIEAYKELPILDVTLKQWSKP